MDSSQVPEPKFRKAGNWVRMWSFGIAMHWGIIAAWSQSCVCANGEICGASDEREGVATTSRRWLVGDGSAVTFTEELAEEMNV